MKIEQALARQFSADKDMARRQRLALADMESGQAIETRYRGDAGASELVGLAAVEDIHRELFSRLPADDLFTPAGEAVVPGQLRQKEVQVGNHVAPAHASLVAFIQRWATAYGGTRRGEATLLAIAAAHQRLGWIHPFIDGNGRVMHLHALRFYFPALWPEAEADAES